MAKKKLDLVLENVTIEAVAAEGKSLAHVDGAVVFVEFAVQILPFPSITI